MWKDIEDDYLYETIEEALLTCCPVCGERIEWDIKLVWNDYADRPVFRGLGFSCGLTFSIIYVEKEEGYKIWTIKN